MKPKEAWFVLLIILILVFICLAWYFGQTAPLPTPTVAPTNTPTFTVTAWPTNTSIVTPIATTAPTATKTLVPRPTSTPRPTNTHTPTLQPTRITDYRWYSCTWQEVRHYPRAQWSPCK